MLNHSSSDSYYLLMDGNSQPTEGQLFMNDSNYEQEKEFRSED
jgi:hypothetical protein